MAPEWSKLFGHCNNVTFWPWVQPTYFSDGIHGIRLLIVGESHYESYPGDVDASGYSTLTNQIIERAITTGVPAFFDRIQDVVSSALGQQMGSRDQFWRTMAFYNFYQRLLTGSKDRPRKSDGDKARLAFEEVLQVLQPQAVLVLGVTTWNGIGFSNGTTSTLFSTDKPSETRLWQSPHRPAMLATWTAHPSDFHHTSFVGPIWRGRISRFLSEVIAWTKERNNH